MRGARGSWRCESEGKAMNTELRMNGAKPMTMQSAQAKRITYNQDDPEYDEFLGRMSARLAHNAAEPLFTTDVEGLWLAYLDALPSDQRQYHTCHCCRNFVERFGGLASIAEDGTVSSAIWDVDDAPAMYKPAAVVMSKLVRRAKVTGVFLTKEPIWGTALSTTPKGNWSHLHILPPANVAFKATVLSAGQKMAERKEDFKTVMAALDEFTVAMLEQAVALLKTDALYRSEKVLGQAEWLLAACKARQDSRYRERIWRMIAKTPAGFCHPRSSMIGTLLEDIASGMDLADVSRRFASKMHPLSYQRPQAEPTSGAIAAAEKIVATLEAAGSLSRRFCRPDEVEALWRPKATKEKSTAGVFGHLSPKATSSHPSLRVPPVTMTWEKFRRTVLPTADKIEYLTRPARETYGVLVTAVNPEATPILQWDRADARNPVSWYVWHGGSTAGEFGLQAGQFVPVTAVTLKPSSWKGSNLSHQGEAVLFILEGARETKSAGNALFPETLKSEFHGIRSVIEAYSRGAKVEAIDGPHAAGPLLSKSYAWRTHFRVTSGGQVLEYKLDRWD